MVTKKLRGKGRVWTKVNTGVVGVNPENGDERKGQRSRNRMIKTER